MPYTPTQSRRGAVDAARSCNGYGRGFKMPNFTYVDLFAGIGGFRIALDEVGGRCLGFSEIDRHAAATYLANFGEGERNFGDVTKIEGLPHADMLVGGVPCQSWSVAGKMLGFDDPRGRLWLDAIRLVGESRPKVFIFENVKGLYDRRNKENLDFLLGRFTEAGYCVGASLLNSYDFGVPQIRSRLFIAGFRNDCESCFRRFSFPIGGALHDSLAKYLDGVEERDVRRRKFAAQDLFGGTVPRSRNPFQKDDELNDFFVMCDTRNGHTTIHSWDMADATARQKEIMVAIMKNRRRKIYGPKDGNPLSCEALREHLPDLRESELGELVRMGLLRAVGGKYELFNSKNSAGIGGVYRMYLPQSKVFSTLTATGTKDVVATDYVGADSSPEEYKREFIEKIVKQKKYRPLTVAETQRIQGFPDSFVPHSVEAVAKKQFGNAVSPPVIRALALALIETGVFGGRS